MNKIIEVFGIIAIAMVASALLGNEKMNVIEMFFGIVGIATCTLFCMWVLRYIWKWILK